MTFDDAGPLDPPETIDQNPLVGLVPSAKLAVNRDHRPGIGDLGQLGLGHQSFRFATAAMNILVHLLQVRSPSSLSAFFLCKLLGGLTAPRSPSGFQLLESKSLLPCRVASRIK